jgi:TolB-like protein
VSRFSLAFAVAGALLLTGPLPAASAEPVKLALLPVVVHSQDRAEYLQAGVGDMLMSRLSQTAGLSVVRVTDLKAATTDLEAARGAARAMGARYVIFGSFTSFGDGASLDLQVARTDASDEGARQVFVQSGALGSIIPRIDDLAERVARYVTEPASAGAVPAVSTAPPAKSAVSRGELDDLRRRVDALEETTRSHATTASGLPPPPKPEPAPVPGSRVNPGSR